LLKLPLVFRLDNEEVRPSSLSHRIAASPEHVASSLQAQAWAQLILSEVVASSTRSDAAQIQRDLRSRLHPHVVHVLEYIAQHYAEPLHADDFAQIAHLSSKHFARLFKSAIGNTPSDYLRSFRLQRAREALSQSEKSIAQVAHECGFEDAAYFSRAFKQKFVLSPQEFRNQLKLQTSSSDFSRSMRPESKR
jgi:two-component system response regulator YesN